MISAGNGKVTFNGTTQNCEFLVAAVNGPSLTTDRFRIKIWIGSQVIYDDQMGDPHTANATVAATSGPTSLLVR